MSAPRVLVVISQVYVPDPASVGQHLADVSRELVRRGLRVRVLTSQSGYDDPTQHYPARQVSDGVEVHRLPFAGFGKASLATRLAGQGSFVAQALARAALMPDVAGVLVSTSPPFCGAAGALLAALHRAPLTYWMMDLNPDQALAMGLVGEGSLPVRVFDALNRFTLRRAARVVVLDRFMQGRVLAKLPVAAKLDVLPPWAPFDEAVAVPPAESPFRREHGLAGRFVVMYSGNHSPANPLTTLLDAAARLRGDPRLCFVFVGGGTGKAEVARRIARGAGNLVSLPYQPLAALPLSLSAADVHVASIGDRVVGIVHPCKAYGAMAVSRPLLVFGPRPSPLADLVDRYRIGWQVRHGDVDGAVTALTEMMAMPPAELAAMGARGAAAMTGAGELSRARLCARLCDLVTATLAR
jgi:colanic acid biosynthesis glycosyl transferase WcaI